MNPWEVLGWLLVVIVGLPLSGALIGVAVHFAGRLFGRHKW